MTGAFEGIRERVKDLPRTVCALEGRGMREPSRMAVQEFLRSHRKGQRILVAAATDSSALGVLDAVRKTGREEDFAIAGQDCIPEVLEEMRNGRAPSLAPCRTKRKATARA